MKYLLLSMFCFISFNNYNVDPETDCFDFAILELRIAELVRGSMMDDEEAFEYMNWSLTACMAQN